MRGKMNKVYIETERLILRPISMFDAKSMYEYAKDEELTKYVLWEPHKNLEITLSVINNMLKKKKVVPVLAIVIKENKKMIGTIEVMMSEEYKLNRRAELGYCISREYWNQGYMTEAASAVMKYIKDKYDLLRIEGRHIEENVASGRVMEKIGMQKEGVLRKFLYIDGKPYNLVVYAKIYD